MKVLIYAEAPIAGGKTTILNICKQALEDNGYKTSTIVARADSKMEMFEAEKNA